MKRFLIFSGSLILTLLLSLSAFAKPKTTTITIFHDASLNGTTIPAGQYVLKYDLEGTNANVKFVQGTKEVASATGQVKTLAKKPGSDQVVFGNNDGGQGLNIKEIQFGGKTSAISFDNGMNTAGK